MGPLESFSLIVLDISRAICRLEPISEIPDWCLQGRFLSVTRTPTELSIVCEQDRVPSEVEAARGWRALQVGGPLDLGLTGVLASLASTLANAGVNLFAVSTFETDDLLVPEAKLARASEALRNAGHSV